MFRSTDSGTSPLLYAAQAGSLESVEWFLSDAPWRHYVEFGASEAAKRDARLMHLSQSPGGFNRAVSRWLEAQSAYIPCSTQIDRRLTNADDLVIHAAIMGPNGTAAERLVKYLIKAHPEFLEAKDSAGMSPLALASLLGRLNLVDILVAHGSDQSTKDENWNNVVHQAIKWQPTASQLRAFLNRLDPDLRSYLLKERSALQSSDGRTPLHRWVGSHRQNSGDGLGQNLEELRLLLGFSDGEELETLDSGGDTPLHTLIRNKEHPAIIRAVIQANPMLLFRENAVGRTPAELAHDMFVRACVQAPPDGHYHGWRQNRSVADILLQKTPEKFAQEAIDKENHTTPVSFGVESDLPIIRQIYDLVIEFAATYPGKRRLVSLTEANDVAVRIGNTYQGQRYGWKVHSSKARGMRTSRRLKHGGREDLDTGSEDRSETGDFVLATLHGVLHSAWDQPKSN